MKHFVSNSTESVRMFKSKWMEALSKVHFTIPLIIYIPVISFFVYKSFSIGILWYHIVLLYLLGIFIWSLTEYVLHRFIFHYQPKGKFGERMHFIFHGVHHDYPNDTMRLVLPPSVSIPLALLFYFLFRAILGETLVLAFFPGFVSGYLFYDTTHYAIHHINFKSKFWVNVKKHHMLHHYRDSKHGFGVSSKFWDKIFKTDF